MAARNETSGTQTNVGAAYIFERNTGTGNWNQVKKIQGSREKTNYYFGYSVSMSGNYAIVGARDEDTDELSNVGAVYIYKNTNGSWNEVQKIQPSDATNNTRFGWDLQIDGSYCVIGSYYKKKAYIFKLDTNGTWNEIKIITESYYNDIVGNIVAIDGNNVVLAASSQVDKVYILEG